MALVEQANIDPDRIRSFTADRRRAGTLQDIVEKPDAETFARDFAHLGDDVRVSMNAGDSARPSSPPAAVSSPPRVASSS